MTIIYEVSSTFDDLPYATREWRKYEKEHYNCKACQRFNRYAIYPIPIDVIIEAKTFDEENNIPVSFSKAVLFHIDFINQIRPYMRNYIFGKCILSDGTQVKEYVTCYTNEIILIRGSLGTEYIECHECKNVVGFPKGPQYTLRSYLTGIGVYQDVTQSLYLDESLVDKIDFSPWPDVVLEPIEVRDEPVDQRRLICDPPNPSWKYDK